jgi:hypothetical protein
MTAAHTVDYSGLSPGEAYAYSAAMGAASLALEWLQQPGPNTAFRSWVSRAHPEVAALSGGQLAPGTLETMSDLFAMQILVLLTPDLLPDEPEVPGYAEEISRIAATAADVFAKRAADLGRARTGPDPGKTASGGFRAHQQAGPGGSTCWCGQRHEY